jgi:hypothetical protein
MHGKEVSKDGRISYEGGWRGGAFHGRGLLVLSLPPAAAAAAAAASGGDNSAPVPPPLLARYRGDFVDGEIEGDGEAEYRDGLVYQGGFKGGRREGQ